MSTPSLLLSLFKHKAWADGEFLIALAQVDAEKHPSQRHSALRLLNHIHVVDAIFAGHLTGKPHGHEATNTVETPTIEQLRSSMVEMDQWYLGYLAQAPAVSLPDTLDFVFTDGKHGNMSREEMLMHVVTHGSYHRGAVGQFLKDASVAPPRDILTGYLHASEPRRRVPS